MATNNQQLNRKSSGADASEHFVFLPNNLTDINSNSNSANPKVRDAIAARNTGNECFEKDQYEEAILHYESAIEILEGIDSNSFDVVLGVCYENRATANASKGNYVDAIADASKAVELNEHHAKAYYRRAMCYQAQERNYRALQDIMQACILERFKNRQYIDAAIKVVAETDKHSPITQWMDAYDDMGAASLFCEKCTIQKMEFVRNCGVFDAISVPIPYNPDNQPRTGYIRAMVGLKRLNIPEVMAGCDEEIELKGEYLAQSYILQAYMNSVVIQLQATIDDDVRRDVQRMNDIISNEAVPDTVMHQAMFCRANIYNRGGKFVEADCDLKSLEDQYGKTGLFHVIKSGALFKFAMKNHRFLRPLEYCAKILPFVYNIQFQVVRAKANHMPKDSAPVAFLIRSLDNIIERFPLELEPRILLIGICLGEDNDKANRTLEQTKKDFSNRLDELSWLYGQMRPTHPSCVDHFRLAIRTHADDPKSFKGLLQYFDTTTYEYAKAIEVSTKAMSNFLKADDFKIMFKHRQQLLRKIIRDNFWKEL